MGLRGRALWDLKDGRSVESTDALITSTPGMIERTDLWCIKYEGHSDGEVVNRTTGTKSGHVEGRMGRISGGVEVEALG